MSLYSKYRPYNFANLVGQDVIRQTLLNELIEGKLTHAYLFAGPRGTGKTSIARILAKELGAGDTDIHEIDAASYTSVDYIRQLREEVQKIHDLQSLELEKVANLSRE